MTHPIKEITSIYGGLAYPEIRDFDITKHLDNGIYDIDLLIPWNDTYAGHAKRIAGIIHKILKGTDFKIKMWYYQQHPYVGILYDGNHRLRAYQYLKKDIAVIFRIEPDGADADNIFYNCGDEI